jgi:DNA-directed RNA polymerase subunit RPC12/RpoP
MTTRYHCAKCGQDFDSDWSTAESDAETLRLFGVRDAHARADMRVVCDACFETMTTRDPPAAWRQRTGGVPQ